jgi:alcohol dehydrogenase class IV
MHQPGILDSLVGILGDRLAAAFEQVHPKVQDSYIEQALGSAIDRGVGVLIGSGGCSPVVTAKAVASGLEERREANHPEDFIHRRGGEGARESDAIGCGFL